MDSRFCYPRALPRIRYDCEDGVTKVRICCLVGRLYDVKNKLNQLLAPGDLLGTNHCPDIGYNTNLNGSVTFWFPPYNGVVGSTWPGLPADYELLYGVDGFLREYYVTGVFVSWKYNCDTGKVTFYTRWADMLDMLGLRLDCHARSIPYVGTVDVNPDWYLSGSIDLPYWSRLDECPDERFSIKLLLTCDVVNDCTPFLCFPLCVVNTCGTDPTVNASILFWDLTCDKGTGNHSGQFNWDVLSNNQYLSSDWPFGGTPSISCVSGSPTLQNLTMFGTTANYTMALSCTGGEASWSHTFTNSFTMPGIGTVTETCILTIYTNNGGA